MRCVNITYLFLLLLEQFLIDQIVNQAKYYRKSHIYVVAWHNRKCLQEGSKGISLLDLTFSQQLI
jgi:hypothetical protein